LFGRESQFKEEDERISCRELEMKKINERGKERVEEMRAK
jgi:hypothetical protein